MDFVAVVDQVIILLRQRGRVAYQTLNRQFQLDDEAIEGLKLEFIDSQLLCCRFSSNWLRVLPTRLIS